MSRYTARRLEEDVEQFNERLKTAGCLKRFEVGGRNGYTAVDQYSVTEDGDRPCSGVDCMVAAGTPRECLATTETAMYRLLLDGKA